MRLHGLCCRPFHVCGSLRFCRCGFCGTVGDFRCRSRAVYCRRRRFCHALRRGGCGVLLRCPCECVDDVDDAADSLINLYGRVDDAGDGLPGIPIALEDVGKALYTISNALYASPCLGEADLASPQHLLIPLPCANEPLHLLALFRSEWILRVGQHFLQ